MIDVGVGDGRLRRWTSPSRRAARCRAAPASAARTATRPRPASSAGARSTAARGCGAGPRRSRPSSPRKRPLWLRIVKASSSACVGCSCMPSPALMIFDLQIRESRWHAPELAWRMTIMSGDIASRLSAVSTRVSPLTTLDVAIGDVQRVGAQPLLGHLERRPGPGAGLEEQVDDGAAAQRRNLFDRPMRDFLHRRRRVENQDDLLRRQVGDAEQVLVLQPCRRSVGTRNDRPPWRHSPAVWMRTSS